MIRTRKTITYAEIIDYIYEKFETEACEKQPVTVKSIASHFKISSRQLDRIYKRNRHLKLTLKEYIRLIQFIFVGKHLFLNPRLPLKQLQPKLGIRSRATFEKLFKDSVRKTAKKFCNKPHTYRQLRILVEEIGMSHF
jgi:methylphosphotriester-DNA--protein-cysteine methyltransferase